MLLCTLPFHRLDTWLPWNVSMEQPPGQSKRCSVDDAPKKPPKVEKAQVMSRLGLVRSAAAKSMAPADRSAPPSPPAPPLSSLQPPRRSTARSIRAHVILRRYHYWRSTR